VKLNTTFAQPSNFIYLSTKYFPEEMSLHFEEILSYVIQLPYNEWGSWCCHLTSSCMRSFLTPSLLMSYIYGAPCKARNFNVVYIWTYVWQGWKPSLSICCTMFQHWINAESFPVSQFCVNTLPATKITLITNGI
jgi:hypothetical protein